MNNIEVDARQVTSMFADLTSRQQRQVYRSALLKAKADFRQGSFQ